MICSLKLPNQGSFIAKQMKRYGVRETRKQACLFQVSLIAASD
jgi:hypothetical protein